MNWDDFYINLAKTISQKSKDPSTKVGAVIVDEKNRVVSLGYNGFPRGIVDSLERYENRPLKYELIIHAELNAIIFGGHKCEGSTLYTWPMISCTRCAAVAIQSGIKKFVAPIMTEELQPRWGEQVKLTELIMAEAGTILRYTDDQN